MTGGRLTAIRPYLDDGEPFCFTYGDGVAVIDIGDLVAFHHAHGKRATITAVSPPGRFGALEFDGDQVRNFREKPAGDGGHDQWRLLRRRPVGARPDRRPRHDRGSTSRSSNWRAAAS